ncbi:AbrB/MazE/SpoVT family DNA-binding domain-containing protein [Ancrocorticia populi]|uniref:AbrB/MazE/SpoVT family DNA-binding domain-containing protein n=1 Tax=Ancrocorticia populi TaxID=2175228 RepID=UPI003F929022
MSIEGLPEQPGKFAASVKVGPKGQIVIPKGARELFGIHPGDTVLVLADAERGIAVLPGSALDQMIETGFPASPQDGQ